MGIKQLLGVVTVPVCVPVCVPVPVPEFPVKSGTGTHTGTGTNCLLYDISGDSHLGLPRD